jgi:hypothetical protein
MRCVNEITQPKRPRLVLGPLEAPQGSDFATEPFPAAQIGSVRKPLKPPSAKIECLPRPLLLQSAGAFPFQAPIAAVKCLLDLTCKTWMAADKYGGKDQQSVNAAPR